MNKEKIKLTKNDLSLLSEKIKPYLTEKRYAHTIAVAAEAAKLAKIYLPEDENRLIASALLHDITKKADHKKQLQYCEEFGIIIDSGDNPAPSVFHAITAECVAARDFRDFTDRDILSGVRWHTTGRAEMSVFEALIFLADYIEPTRDFPDCIKLRKYFYDKLNDGEDAYSVLTDTMILAFDMTLKLLIENGDRIDKNTTEARNYYVDLRQSRIK